MATEQSFGWGATVPDLLNGIATLDDRSGPQELINEWFDDLYQPGMWGPSEKNRPGVIKAVRNFNSCFTSEQLFALRKFHGIFLAELDELSRYRDDWKGDPGWIRVSQAAKVALRAFHEDEA